MNSLYLHVRLLQKLMIPFSLDTRQNLIELNVYRMHPQYLASALWEEISRQHEIAF